MNLLSSRRLVRLLLRCALHILTRACSLNTVATSWMIVCNKMGAFSLNDATFVGFDVVVVMVSNVSALVAKSSTRDVTF